MSRLVGVDVPDDMWDFDPWGVPDAMYFYYTPRWPVLSSSRWSDQVWMWRA